MATRKPRKPSTEVVVVGSYNQALVWQSTRFPEPGETRLGRYTGGPGGKGFNQAVAAARLGARTCFIAAIGRDPLGEAAQALAISEGIAARWQRVSAEATGTAAIWLDASGQNMIIVAPGANALLSPAHVLAQRDAIAGARVLVTQQEVHPVAIRRALELAGELGVLRLHNPAPPLDPAAMDALLALTDVLTPNESEFAALLRARGIDLASEAVAGCSDATLHRYCRLLEVPSVVLTLGAAGVFVSHADGSWRGDPQGHYRIAAEAAHVVDTTGAGDAFNGGLAASLASRGERPFAEHLRHANRVAACAVEAHGAALAMPRLDDLQRRFGD